jgi:hypothetical protein
MVRTLSPERSASSSWDIPASVRRVRSRAPNSVLSPVTQHLTSRAARPVHLQHPRLGFKHPLVLMLVRRESLFSRMEVRGRHRYTTQRRVKLDAGRACHRRLSNWPNVDQAVPSQSDSGSDFLARREPSTYCNHNAVNCWPASCWPGRRCSRSPARPAARNPGLTSRNSPYSKGGATPGPVEPRPPGATAGQPGTAAR